MKDRQKNARRILSALSHIANVIEEIEGVPGMKRHADSLDNAANAICLEVNSLLQLQNSGREYVEEGFPAVYDRWGEAFEA
jgi:hypothetical protein